MVKGHSYLRLFDPLLHSLNWIEFKNLTLQQFWVHFSCYSKIKLSCTAWLAILVQFPHEELLHVLINILDYIVQQNTSKEASILNRENWNVCQSTVYIIEHFTVYCPAIYKQGNQHFEWETFECRPKYCVYYWTFYCLCYWESIRFPSIRDDLHIAILMDISIHRVERPGISSTSGYHITNNKKQRSTWTQNIWNDLFSKNTT